MHYRTYSPHPLLAPYIKCYWSMEQDADASQSPERVFPDGCTELVFHLGDLFKKYVREDIAALQPRSFIHGQIKAYMLLAATGKTGIFSVRFHPNGLKPFTAFSQQELTSDTVGLADCWGREGDVLEDQVLNAANHEQRIVLLERFLIGQLRRRKEGTDLLIDHCVAAIVRGAGHISINALAAGLNIGRRHLERRFLTSVGLSPKSFSRITRFQHTLALIERRRHTPLTTIAYAGGFYDQAHFIKDFKTFTGLNPGQYFSADLQLAKSFCAG